MENLKVLLTLDLQKSEEKRNDSYYSLSKS
jgi:hypothetical protein